MQEQIECGIKELGSEQLMIKYELEFLYNNVEIQIMNFFGFSYNFSYAGVDYTSSGSYFDIDNCKNAAKLHVNKVIRKDKSGDNLEMNV